MNKFKKLMISASTFLVLTAQPVWSTEIPSPAEIIGPSPFILFNDTTGGRWWLIEDSNDSLCPHCLLFSNSGIPLKQTAIYMEPQTSNLLYLANGSLDNIGGHIGIGTVTPDPSYRLDVRGKIKALFSGFSGGGDGFTPVASLEAFNTAVNKSSDSGFALKNLKVDFQWNFRTLEASGAQGFSATKNGSGGAEMIVQNPTNDFHNVSMLMGNGARLTSTGQWINASSRKYKENIVPIALGEAINVLEQLNPVKYFFKRDTDKELNLGFIAEDVPELVATKGRKNMDTMEVVAALTKVVQHQHKVIQKQQEDAEKVQKTVAEQEKVIRQQVRVAVEQRKISMALSEKLAELDQLVRSSGMVVMK